VRVEVDYKDAEAALTHGGGEAHGRRRLYRSPRLLLASAIMRTQRLPSTPRTSASKKSSADDVTLDGAIGIESGRGSPGR
jgi:hypothetical protein